MPRFEIKTRYKTLKNFLNSEKIVLVSENYKTNQLKLKSNTIG